MISGVIDMNEKHIYYSLLSSIISIILVLLTIILYIFAYVIEFGKGIDDTFIIGTVIYLIIFIPIDYILIFVVLKYTLVKFSFYSDRIVITPFFGKLKIIKYSSIIEIKNEDAPQIMGPTDGFKISYIIEEVTDHFYLIKSKKTEALVSDIKRKCKLD